MTLLQVDYILFRIFGFTWISNIKCKFIYMDRLDPVFMCYIHTTKEFVVILQFF